MLGISHLTSSFSSMPENWAKRGKISHALEEEAAG